MKKILHSILAFTLTIISYGVWSAAQEVITLDEASSQLEAPQAGDTYLMPRDTAITGFTQLGSVAPSIKQKKLTGTTGGTEGVTTNIVHGFADISKILGFHVLVRTGSGNRVPPAFASVAEHEYDAFMDATNIVVALTATNSGSLLNRAITVLIIYEE